MRRRQRELARIRLAALLCVIGIAAVVLLIIFGGKALRGRKDHNAAADAQNMAQTAELSGTETDPAKSGADGPLLSEETAQMPGLTAGQAEAGASAGSITDGAKAAGEESGSLWESAPEPEQSGAFQIFADEGDVQEITDEAVESKYVVLVDVDQGKIIAGRDYDVRMVPASMTKVMSLLVAIEHLSEDDLDQTFEITQELTDYCYIHKFSVVGFMPGDTPTVRDMLYGMILESGADAAVGLAEYICGSQEAFVELMNEKLRELGISDTAHFTNCIGLYDEDHYCTVLDMAVIMKAAVENETCREYLSRHTYTTTPTQEHPEGITISNWFLRRIEDKDNHGLVDSAKTGFVNESGYCAVSYQIANDGTKHICVTGDTYHTWVCIYDHMHMYQDFTE